MNKLTAIAIAFMLWTATAFSFNKYLDIELVSEVSHLEQKMHIDVGAEGAFLMGEKVFIVNPKLSLFLDKSMDASIATGMRYKTALGCFGHHIFWDSSSTKDGHFNQIGTSFDLLTDFFDYRINYYHPLTRKQKTEEILSRSHRWVESEVIFKHPYFQVGMGPKYNLFEKEWGTQMRISVPFHHFNIEAFISHDSKNKFYGCMSFSFSLYSTPRSDYFDAPISHRSRVQYSKEPIYIPEAQVTKKKDQEELVLIVEKEPKEIVPTAPAEAPEENTHPHWYDFFLLKW